MYANVFANFWQSLIIWTKVWFFSWKQSFRSVIWHYWSTILFLLRCYFRNCWFNASLVVIIPQKLKVLLDYLKGTNIAIHILSLLLKFVRLSINYRMILCVSTSTWYMSWFNYNCEHFTTTDSNFGNTLLTGFFQVASKCYLTKIIKNVLSFLLMLFFYISEKFRL